MGVQELPEAVEQLSALQAAALRVDEHQQGTDVQLQLVVLEDNRDREGQRKTTETMRDSVVL